MQSLPAGGKMSAVFTEEARIKEVIQPFRDQVSIAAINGPTNIVISGDGNAMDAICTLLEAAGIKFRPLNVSHAFHSPLMEPILGAFEQAASTITYHQPQLRLISNLTGQLVGEDPINARYWREHVRQPVQFAAAIDSLLALNVDILLEVGPSPTLSSLVKRIPGTDKRLVLPTLRQGREDWTQILESLGKLFTQGIKIDWVGFDRPYDRKRLILPTYPFQRQQYWISPSSRRTYSKKQEQVHPLLGQKLSSPLKTVQFEAYLDHESFTFIRDHKVRGTSILPMTAYLEMAHAAANVGLGKDGYQLCDVVIHQPLVLEKEDFRTVHFLLNGETNDNASFEIYSHAQTDKEENWSLHASGRMERAAHPVPGDAESLVQIKGRCNQEIDAQEHYQQLQERGFPFGPAMQGVKYIWHRDGEALVEIQAPSAISDEMGTFNIHPALLDACLQCFWTTFDPSDRNTYLPMNLESFHLLGPLPQRIWSHIRLRAEGKEKSEAIVGDVQVMDENHQIVAEINGLYFRPASAQLFQVRHEWDDWFYQVEWQLQPQLQGPPEVEPTFLSIADLVSEVDPQVSLLAEEHRIDRYRDLFPEIERLSARYVAAAFKDLGLNLQVGQRISVQALIANLGIAERYNRLTYRLLDILSGAGYLQRAENEWEVMQVPGPEMKPDRLAAELQALLARYPESRGQLTLTGQCGESLSGVLNGKVDPLSLLFPDGSLEMTEFLYRESPQSRIFNSMVRDGIQKVLASMPADKPVRILEIGAGTGGTTSYVLPILPAERTEYFFTDISPLFLSRAKDRFSQFDFVGYELLNVENDPAAQGFENESFDIVVAVNVLHATVDMAETLSHVKQLMKPNGILMLVEGTHPENWVDVTFGLTDGWWRFSDTQLREDYPLMSREKWDGLLTQAGFMEFTALPRNETLFQQALILAKPAPTTPGHWVIFSDECGVGQSLAERLSALHQTCTFVTAGEGFNHEHERFTIDPSSAGDFKQLLHEVIRNTPENLRGIVYLWPLDMTKNAGLSLEASQAVGLGGAVYLAQALATSEIELPRLSLVTRCAQRVSERDSLEIEEYSPVGLGESHSTRTPRITLHPDRS